MKTMQRERRVSSWLDPRKPLTLKVKIWIPPKNNNNNNNNNNISTKIFIDRKNYQKKKKKPILK